MYKACIFDLDGTLTNTLESITHSVNLVLQEMGFEKISEDACRSFVGDGARCLMERALSAIGQSSRIHIEEAMERYSGIFDRYCTYHVEPYEGIRCMLDCLEEKGIKVAVLSNKPHPQTIQVVQTIFGKDRFTYVQGQCETIPKKPDPSGIYVLLEQLQMTESQCLYIGDSEVDMKTGWAAGVTTIGVSWGYREREVLIRAGADYIIDEPTQLLNYI